MHAPFYYFPKGVCQWCNMWSRMRRIFCKNQWLLYNVLCLVALSCPTLCDPLDCSLQAPLSMGVLQARIREWVAVPSLQGIFPTQGLNPGPARCRQIFTAQATREAQEYWSREPVPSPRDLPDQWIEPGSPALQAGSLPTEQSGKPSLSEHRVNGCGSQA